MEAEKQLKEPISRISHSRSGGGNMSFVDNRPKSINQAKVIDSIQKKKDSLLPITKRGDGVGCILQRTRDHVDNFGCEWNEAANQNFQAHMSGYVDDPRELSRNRGIVTNTIIYITDEQLAEEIAVGLYTWPEGRELPEKPSFITNAEYVLVIYEDGELLSGKSYRFESGKSYRFESTESYRFEFLCQLVNRGDGTQYYEAYHLNRLIPK